MSDDVYFKKIFNSKASYKVRCPDLEDVHFRGSLAADCGFCGSESPIGF